MHGLGEVIFGSSNWTTASAGYQDEHNYFYKPSLNKPWFFQWFADQFNRKWNDTINYVPFEPLPPGSPQYSLPLNGSAGIGSSVRNTARSARSGRVTMSTKSGAQFDPTAPASGPDLVAAIARIEQISGR